MKKVSLVVLCGLLASCASVPKPATEMGNTLSCEAVSASNACASAIDTLASASNALFAAQNDSASAYAFDGRVAISQGSNGGNARIDWNAASMVAYTIELTAPITAQTWRLEVTPDSATVHGIKGGPRSSDDPAALLKQATGWNIPLDEMRYWLRALPAPGSEATQFVFSKAQTPRVLGFTQAGWTLKFEGGAAGEPPQRIFAKNGASQVRLIIDNWSKKPDQ